MGRHKIIGPDGATPWLVSIALDDGGSLRLGGRGDGERLALLGAPVIVRGTLVLSPPRPPPHVASMDPAPTLAGATVELRGELPVFDTVAPGLTGRRELVDIVTTHLEMQREPAGELPPAPDGVKVVRATPPGVRFYRYLYDAVGAPWHWYDRKSWSDAQLAAVVDHPRVEVHVLWRRGVPAGYVELDRRSAAACEVAYFGLVPEAIGGGLGTWFLRWAVREAWRDEALARLWVHTCTLDHASALAVYQTCGFHPFRHERHRGYVVHPAPPGR
jgi:GNAT superfamily N-acetyltransferase